MQEDEGATIRIGELEHKLRLAEQMADLIYGKYKELAREAMKTFRILHCESKG